MKAVIESEFKVRGEPISSYYSFPVYSDEIERTLVRELEFLSKQPSEFSLSLRLERKARAD
jgi:hypothetical protein